MQIHHQSDNGEYTLWIIEPRITWNAMCMYVLLYCMSAIIYNVNNERFIERRNCWKDAIVQAQQLLLGLSFHSFSQHKTQTNLGV